MGSSIETPSVESFSRPTSRSIAAGTAWTPGPSSGPPQIVLYRRPLELRALDPDDLAELVLDVLIHEVADLLGVGPEVIDPEGHGDADYDD